MVHSRLTSKNQTTIPAPVRELLNLKPGDTIAYELEPGRVTLRVHPGLASLAGILSSKKGRGMSFAQIRSAAANSPGAKARAIRKGWTR